MANSGQKITKARIEISFNNAIEMFKEGVAVLKEHIHIKRRQVNAYREMKESLTNDELMVHVDLQKVTKMSIEMLSKVPTLETSVLVFLQPAAILKFQKRLKMIMLYLITGN